MTEAGHSDLSAGPDHCYTPGREGLHKLFRRDPRTNALADATKERTQLRDLGGFVNHRLPQFRLLSAGTEDAPACFDQKLFS